MLSLNRRLTSNALKTAYIRLEPGQEGPTDLTNEEYHFLSDRDWRPEDMTVFYHSGDSCHKKGLIDVFGILTERGTLSVERFENE